MLHATDLLGGEAYDRDGHFVGQVTELFIEPADQPNRVARFLLGRGKFLPLIARYDHIAFVAPGVIRLNVEEKELEHYQPNEAWLAMRKDLLDHQIIDTSGRKVVRVNDIQTFASGNFDDLVGQGQQILRFAEERIVGRLDPME